MDKKTFDDNIAYLLDNKFALTGHPVWPDKPDSVELQTYTDAGEDMYVCLDAPTKECLQQYIDDFDIYGNVDIWWQHGRPGRGVPFSNREEHRQDYRNYLHDLREICRRWPDGRIHEKDTKKAVIVTFTIRTRVLVDIPAGMTFADASIEDNDGLQAEAFDKAIDNIKGNIDGYLCYDNAEAAEDTECPYER